MGLLFSEVNCVLTGWLIVKLRLLFAQEPERWLFAVIFLSARGNGDTSQAIKYKPDQKRYAEEVTWTLKYKL